MKKLLQMKTMLLLCALIVGSGSVWAEDVTGNIKFGSGSGRTNVNSASVSGDDSQDNTWTITTVGTTSFTPNSGHSQIGSSSKPASSITFKTTLPYEVNINSFVAKFGGFSGTAGTVTLKVGDTTVGTGSLNATSDVTVSSSLAAKGTVLTVTVTSISKGVKAYEISYTYSSKPSAGVSASDIDGMIAGTTMEDFYSITADDYDGVLSFESDDESIAKVEEGVLKAIGTGTATITISADETEKYAPVYVQFDVTVKNRDAVAPEGQNVGGGYTLVTDASTLKEGDKLIIVNSSEDGTRKAMSTTQNSNNRGITNVTVSGKTIASVGNDVEILTLEGNSDGWYFKGKDSKYLYAPGGGNYLRSQTSTDENAKATVSIDGYGYATVTFNTSATQKYMRYNASNSIYSCYASTSSIEDLPMFYKQMATSSFNTTISSALWKTFVSAKNVSLPEGLEAYVVTAENTTSATLEKVTGNLKANEPYLLKAVEAGDYTLTIEESASAPASNLLQITDESTSNGVYVLTNKTYGVGFYLWQGGNLGAGRVYLPAPESGDAREFISFDSDATGIEKIENATSNKENGVVFNLAGQRVAQPSKGLYIVNGRKVIVK